MKILIVDDEKENLYLLERIITKIGYETVMAENGKLALEKLYNENFLMVISDILMPVLDGFQLCKTVRSIKKFNNILFVFYTATYLEKDDEEFALELGADKFLRKPIEPQKFIEEIEELIQKKAIIQSKQREISKDKEKEIMKLYNERLIHKLEKKTVNLEKETIKRNKAIYTLKERVKELTFLYKMSNLIERSDLTVEEIFQRIIDFFPSSMQFPNLTSAKINFYNNEFITRNFKETKWKLSEETDLNGKSLKIEIFYSQDKPFLEEEKDLLNEIGKRLKTYLLQKKKEKKANKSLERIKLLSKFPEVNPNPIIRITTEGMVIFHNKASIHILETWGFSEGFLHSQKLLTLLKSVESVPRIIQFDVKVLNILYSVSIIPIENTPFLNVYALDITKREEVALELIQSRSKYFDLFNNMLDGYIYCKIITDSNGNPIDSEILDINPAFSLLTGITREMGIGKRVTEVIPGIQDDPNDWIGKIGDVALNEKILSFEFFLEPLQKYYAVSAYCPEPNHVVAVFRDITENVNAEEKLNQINESLELRVKERTKDLNEALIQEKLYKEELLKASQFKSEFMASMSHELRTPLNSVIGFTDVILEGISGEINEDQEKYLTNVRTSALHLLDLINDVLDIAKIESGKIDLHIEDVNLSQIINQVNAMLRPTYEKKNLKFEVQKIDQKKVIQVDRLRLKEILYNLLSNAIKYTEKGGVTLEIFENEEDWVFTVIDTGICIKKEDYDLIFKEFKRVKSEYTNSIEGTGLGLPLTKKFIELHGGNISFTSKIGEGTTFIFTIPKLK
ncbi:MAG: ATP-binding protein [Promethearchaeota archaeon]